jgi:hypothetical protein
MVLSGPFRFPTRLTQVDKVNASSEFLNHRKQIVPFTKPNT